MDQVPCHKKCYNCGEYWAQCLYIYEGKYFCDAQCLEDYAEQLQGEFLEVKKTKIKTCMGCEKDL